MKIASHVNFTDGRGNTHLALVTNAQGPKGHELLNLVYVVAEPLDTDSHGRRVARVANVPQAKNVEDGAHWAVASTPSKPDSPPEQAKVKVETRRKHESPKREEFQPKPVDTATEKKAGKQRKVADAKSVKQ